jgi:hypothetical protein
LKRRFRIVLGLFIVALVMSGITAFPLRLEMELLAGWLGIDADADPATLGGWRYWIAHIRSGLERSYDAYPFLAYGTDWLAFAHLVIAVFFLGALRRPADHDWTLVSGMIACAGVLPLALICGPLRGIPPFWRLIDCSFGILGVVPLAYCLYISRKLRALAASADAAAGSLPHRPDSGSPHARESGI